jgi:hypothetical protein
MDQPKLEYILLRPPRTDEQGNKIQGYARIVRASETDLTGYSCLSTKEPYEEWVPTRELELYKKARE